ncbi:hypothetical protein [Ulvibacterium sp.]|uniref:hypothetical protein n=1 Tax=Ulvibacterium sp. TaxID=2665914 RepID=UPI003CC57BF6
MRLSQLLVLSLVFVFTNCSKDETLIPDSDSKEEPKLEEPKPEPEDPNEPETEVYFTYSSYPSDADNWIIIHDSEGQLIDYKMIEDGGPVEFLGIKDSIPEKISITEFFYSVDGGNNPFHSLLTYTDIEPGSVWNNFHNPPQGNLMGKFSLRIENIPGLKSNTLSTPRGSLNASDTQVEGDFNNSTLNLIDIPLYENEDYLLSIYDNSDGHKYVFLPKPQDGLDSIIDYSQFLEYDTYLEIDLPTNDFALLYIQGYSSDDPNYFWTGQTLSFNLDFSAPTMTRAGYLDIYEKYRTEFSIRSDGWSYSFSQSGAMVEDIAIPMRPSFTLENASLYDLSFASDKNFITKNTTHSRNFTDGDGIYSETIWYVRSSGNTSHKVGELPEEILLKYPAMNPESLELQSINLITQGFSQQELFNQMTNKEKKGDFIEEGFVFTNF